jgi:predicted ArsR family transcriptional regulator
MTGVPRCEDIASLAVLAEPSRRRVYDHVLAMRQAVTKDDVAVALGIGRTLAAYHLDRLVTAGLLTASYARVTGRTGPGAGRTAKLYALSPREFHVSEPARDYETLARLLAIAAAGDGSEQRRAEQTAHSSGAAVGRSVRGRTAREVLAERGYAPFADQGEIRLANCPFHQLAQDHRELVCGMNRALIQGILEGLQTTDVTASLDPRPGHCCVALVRANPPA